MGHKASMSIRSLAACWTSPHDRFICSSSCVTVLRQGFIWPPRFSFVWWCPSSGPFCDAVLLHPQHMSQPSQASVRNILGDAPASRFLVQVIVGDLIRPKDLAYSSKASIMEHFHSLMTVPTTRQLSEPYSRPDFTLLLYRSIFVLRLYCLIHMGWEIKP